MYNFISTYDFLFMTIVNTDIICNIINKLFIINININKYIHICKMKIILSYKFKIVLLI